MLFKIKKIKGNTVRKRVIYDRSQGYCSGCKKYSIHCTYQYGDPILMLCKSEFDLWARMGHSYIYHVI